MEKKRKNVGTTWVWAFQAVGAFEANKWFQPSQRRVHLLRGGEAEREEERVRDERLGYSDDVQNIPAKEVIIGF